MPWPIRHAIWQVQELADFVEKVDSQAYPQFASLVSGSPLAMATIRASALVVLYRRIQPGTAGKRCLRPPT